MSRRQQSMLVLLGTFVINRLICSFLNKYDKEGTKKAEKVIVKPLGIIITMALVVVMSLMLYKTKINDPYVSPTSYPVKASEWILENLDIKTMKIYNEYNFGSYLLYKGIPVFIDSRADLYAPEFNGKKDIFTDFLNINSVNLFDMQSKLDEYGFTHLITSKNARLNIYLNLKPEIYRKIYSDDNFIIYENIQK